MTAHVSTFARTALILAFAVIAYAGVILGAVFVVTGGPGSLYDGQYIVPLVFFAPAAAAGALLARAWWRRSRSHLSALDGPARVLAVAVGALPAERADWAAAMRSELAGVRGRSARWQFALSAAQAAVLPPPTRWRSIAVASGAAAALVVAATLAVGRAMPEFQVFAFAFTALVAVGAVVVVARRRPLAPSLTIAVIVAAEVAGCIAATVYVLSKDPAASVLGHASAVVLAIVLAGCLWLALTPPRALLTSRLARGLGIGVGLALGAGLLRSSGFPNETGAGVLDFVVFGTLLVFFVGSGLAALLESSFRSGVQTAVWGGTVGVLLMFGLWLVEGVRWYEAGAGLLADAEYAPTMGANLPDAVFFDFFFMLWALPFGVFGSALGAWMGKMTGRRARPNGVYALTRRT